LGSASTSRPLTVILTNSVGSGGGVARAWCCERIALLADALRELVLEQPHCRERRDRGRVRQGTDRLARRHPLGQRLERVEIVGLALAIGDAPEDLRQPLATFAALAALAAALVVVEARDDLHDACDRRVIVAHVHRC